VTDHKDRSIECVETRYGQIYIPKNNDLISNSIREYGEWAHQEISCLTQFLQKGDVALDVGSCYGIHSVAFAKKVGTTGQVFSFEALQENFEILQRNIESSDFKKITPHHVAIGNKNGMAHVHVQKSNAGASWVSIEDDTGQEVDIRRLDDIYTGRVDFIKLDIEGLELDALKGADKLIRSQAPVVFAEINTPAAALALWDYAERKGYHSFLLVSEPYNRHNFRKSATNIFGDSLEAGLVLVPKCDPSALAVAKQSTELTEVCSEKDIIGGLRCVPQMKPMFSSLDVSARNSERSETSPQRHIAQDKQNIDKYASTSQTILDLENEVRRLHGELDDFKALYSIERDRAEQYWSRLQSAVDLLRHPVRSSIKRNVAKSLLRNARWLSDKRRTKLRLSVEKREYRSFLRPTSTSAPTRQNLNTGDMPPSHIAQFRDFGKIASPVAPSDLEWSEVTPEGGLVADAPLVDLIVPVYKGYDETLRCLFSVITAKQNTPFRLIVINDCSPDPNLSAKLRDLHESGFITLIENEANMGFVLSCNIGMRLNPERDVILLNSDTLVYSNWLDRVMAAAKQYEDAGSLTPLSNNATICSYPYFCEDNFQELEIDGRTLDAICASACDSARPVQIPTAVGFCMYLRRQALNEVGLFDEERFGKGYGEENDLSRRLAKCGWTNLLIPNVYIRHWGSVSFGNEASSKQIAAGKVIDELYPEYHGEVADFIAADPILPVRARIDAVRIASRARNNSILFVTHDRGGGTESHVRFMKTWIEEEGFARVIVCRPHPHIQDRFYIEDSEIGPTPNFPLGSWLDNTRTLEGLFESIGVTRIHVHHLIGHGLNAIDSLYGLAKSGKIPVDVTLHDYFKICPRVNLIDGSGTYCGEPDASICQSCVDKNGHESDGKLNMTEWRSKNLRFLESVNTVYAPSRDVAKRFERYLDRKDVTIRNHPTSQYLLDAEARPLTKTSGDAAKTLRRIGILGAIGPHKGSEVVLETARAAQSLGLPLEFVVIGYTDRDSVFADLENVHVTGAYQAEEVVDRIAEASPDLIWIPSVWPETFCFTLSEAIAAGVQPVAFELGAQADRISQIGWGSIMPKELMNDPVRAADWLADCEIIEPDEHVRERFVQEYSSVEGYLAK
jgi:FkbM family methyltransferase